jgi:hypothetical protein
MPYRQGGIAHIGAHKIFKRLRRGCNGRDIAATGKTYHLIGTRNIIAF